MAGMVGVIGEPLPAEPKARALSRLRHGPEFTGEWLFEANGNSLGAVFRRGTEPRVHAAVATGVCIVVYGSPLIRDWG